MKEIKKTQKPSANEIKKILCDEGYKMSQHKRDDFIKDKPHFNIPREMYPYHYKNRNIFPIVANSNNSFCNNYTYNNSINFNKHF